MNDFTEAELVEMERHAANGGAFAADDVGRLLKALRLWNERAHGMFKQGMDLAGGLSDSAMLLENAGSKLKTERDNLLLQNDELRKALRGILQYGTRTVDDDDETPMGVQIEGCHVQSLRLEKDWRAAIEVAFPEKPCQELNFRTEPCTLKAGHCGSHVFADKRVVPEQKKHDGKTCPECIKATEERKHFSE